MTREEIMMEMKACKNKINQIHKQLDDVEEFKKRMELIDEMIDLAQRMSELDTMNKEMLLTEHQMYVNELFSMIKGVFRR